MPSYFCCKCHKMVSHERTVPPETYLCPDCREERESNGEPGQAGKKEKKETAEEEYLEVCSVGDWK